MPTFEIPTSAQVFGTLPGQHQVGGAVNGPGALSVFGHSFWDPFNGVSSPNLGLAAIGPANLDLSLFRQTLAALKVDESRVINCSVNQANIIQDNTAVSPGGFGGHVTVLQNLGPINIRQAFPGQRPPWMSNSGACLAGWGINDINSYAGGPQNGFYRNLYVEAHRTVFSRFRAAAVYEAATDATIVYSGGGLGGTDWTLRTATNINSGPGYATAVVIGGTATFSTTSDFDGGIVALGFIGCKGGLGGAGDIFLDGKKIDSINLNNATIDAVSAGGGVVTTGTHIVLTRRYLVPSGVHTFVVICTDPGIGNGFAFNFYQIEGKEGNPIIWVNCAKLRSYTGGVISNGNLDVYVDDWNQAIRDLIRNEFPEPIEEANLDFALAQTFNGPQNNRCCFDGIHASELGARYGAASILDAWTRINDTSTLAQSTTNQRDTLGTGFSVPLAPTAAGAYVYPVTLSSSATAALTAGGTVLYLCPMLFTRPCTIDQIVFDSMTVGTGNSRLGLYYDKGNAISFAPWGAQYLAYDWGNFANGVAVAKTYTIPAGQRRIQSPGLYWFAQIVLAASTCSATRLVGSHPMVNSNIGARPIVGSGYTYTFGVAQTVLPPTLTVFVGTLASVASIPFVGLTVLSTP